jgi:hypothetical protein
MIDRARLRAITPAQVGAGLLLAAAIAFWLRTSARALDLYQHSSDFNVIAVAANLLWRGEAIYRPFDLAQGAVFQTGSTSISYPPTTFLLLAPWAAMPEPWRALTWMAVQQLSLVVVIAGTYLAIGRPRRTEAMLAVAVCLVLYPLRDNLSEGQLGLPLTALTVVAMVAHERRLPVLGGMALAVAIALKLTPMLVLPFFLYLRAFRLVAWTAATVALIFAGTLLVGWGAHWPEYLQLVGPLGRGTAIAANQGLNGVLLRIWFPGLVGQPITPLPTWFRAAWYAGNVVILGGLALLVRRAGRVTVLDRWLGLALVLTGLALVEPFAWVHHFTGLAVAAIVAARLVREGAIGPWAKAVLLAAGAFLAFGARPAIVMAPPRLGGLSMAPLTTSLTFAAVLLVVGVLGLTRRAAPSRGAGPGALRR